MTTTCSTVWKVQLDLTVVLLLALPLAHWVQRFTGEQQHQFFSGKSTNQRQQGV